MQFVLNYPDTLPGLLKRTSDEFNNDLNFIIAGKLYDMGKLSAGKAAELAGVDRIEFLQRLAAYGFNAINIDDEQIDIEIQSVRELS